MLIGPDALPLTIKVVLEARNVIEDQLFTRFATFTEPRPVARSYPTPALNPESTPYWSALFDVVQLRDPFVHGMAFVPVVRSLKIQVLAGPFVALELQFAAVCLVASL